MSDKPERLTEISGYSKLCLQYIRKLTVEIIDLLKMSIDALSEHRKNFLEDTEKRSLELSDVWQGLQKHLKGILYSYPYCIPSTRYDNLMSQKYQLSFLMSSLAREVSSCCATTGARATDRKLEEFKACFQLLQNLLEGPLEVLKE
jgi:hypothetical protein